MNNLKNKSVKAVLVLVVLVVVAVLLYRYLPAMPKNQIAGPVITGGLVKIEPTALTVKAADGTEMKFVVTSATPVYSYVKEGEVGRTYEQLTVGDVLAVTSSTETTSQKIEIIPLYQPLASSSVPITVTGTVVGTGTSSITVQPYAANSAQATAKVTVRLDKNTTVLTQVLGGQTGKPLGTIPAGSGITVRGVATEKGLIADTVLLIFPKQ